MKKTRFTEQQIMAVLREAERGVAVPAVCRTYGISILQMAREVCGKAASMVSQMTAMEEENLLLKRMFADLSMQADLLRKALGKK